MFGFSKAPARIYMDYASAPPVLPEAEDAVREASRFIGNPGGIHREAVEAKSALEDARARTAALLGVKAREIIFTSGLTDANNIAIVGAARAYERRERGLSGTHWIVSAIEHSSVLDCFGEIERLGGDVSYVDPNDRGIITPEAVHALLRKETVLVSIGWANNEIGVIQPLSEIARAIESFENNHACTILLHTDAGQAPLYLATGLNSLRVDLCSIGGNKLYGPHGIGVLFVSNRASLARVAHGGPQERGLKPGTESVALAIGFVTAFESIVRTRGEEARRIKALRDRLEAGVRERISGVVVNGDLRHAMPHMLNISIPGVQSEYVTLSLDQAGIAVSTKSACREGEQSRSHVVEALGGDAWRAENTFRFSLGRDTNDSAIDRTLDALSEIVARVQVRE